MQSTDLLIIGAGPFGLAVAAHAKLSGIAVTVVGGFVRACVASARIIVKDVQSDRPSN